MGDAVSHLEGAVVLGPLLLEIGIQPHRPVGVRLLVEDVGEVAGALPQLRWDDALGDDEVAADLRKETGRVLVGLGGDVVPFGFREEKRLLGPCDSHVHQPSLLLLAVFLTLADGSHIGEDALAEAGDEDIGELQPLGLVDGHQLEGGGVPPVVVVGVEGDVLEVIRQGALVGCADALVETDGGEEFVKVLQAVLILVLPDHPLVAGGFEDAVEEVTHAVLPGELLGILDEGDEALGLIREIDLQGTVEGDALPCGGVPHGVQELLAELPGRDVDDTLETDVVVLVANKAEVTEGVLYLPPLEKARAAPDGVVEMGVEEFLLQGPRLVGAPVEDGDVVDACSAGKEHPYLRDYPLHLLLLALPVEMDDGLAFGLPGEEVLGDAVLIV